MENLRDGISAVLAGMMIGVGATSYVACEQKYLGAFLFTIGLLAICIYGMNLFTGKIGYLLDRDKSYWPFLGIVWIGNFVGTYIMAGMLRAFRPDLVAKCATMCQAKLAETPIQTIVLGIFCGLLVYIAVDCYKKQEDLGRYLGVLIGIPAFIVCGFEHVVADMYYFSVASLSSVANGHVWIFLLLTTVGNSIGSLLIPLYQKMQAHGAK